MHRIKKLNKSNMYLLVTYWPDQNPILFSCGCRRRSNHLAPSSLPQHALKRSLLLTTLLLLHLLTTLLLLRLLNTLLLLLLNMLLLLLLVSTRIP
jgi:hypothetical protein